MEELVNLIANDSSAAEISDNIKDILFAKAATKIDANKPEVALSMFDRSEPAIENSEEE